MKDYTVTERNEDYTHFHFINKIFHTFDDAIKFAKQRSAYNDYFYIVYENLNDGPYCIRIYHNGEIYE